MINEPLSPHERGLIEQARTTDDRPVIDGSIDDEAKPDGPIAKA
jgi:hypothetical protein